MSSSLTQSSQWFGNFATATLDTKSGNAACSPSASDPNSKVYVEHNYTDHCRSPIYRPLEHISNKRRGPRGGVLVPFPEKLYDMLTQVSADGLDDVVSWQPHGRSFLVHQPERFVEEVIPRYFSQTKLTSFQRQVNLYGFRRLTAGSDRNGYYHEFFLRGRPDLLKRMSRVRVKGIGCKLAPSPATEPNFYRLPYCYESDSALAGASSAALEHDIAAEQNITNRLLLASMSSTSGCRGGPILTLGKTQPLKQKSANERFGLHDEAASQLQPNIQQTPSCDKLVPCNVGSSSMPPQCISKMIRVISDGAPAPDSVDLSPLPSNSRRNYLLEMQDDILAVLASPRSSSDDNFYSFFRIDSHGHSDLSDVDLDFWDL